MFLILDTSAILSGRFNSIPPGFESVIITDEVKNEIGKGAPARTLENLLEMGLEVRSPPDIETAKEKASLTGDLELLSPADLSIIALAMELRDVSVVTDDFRIQNVLSSVEIEFIPAGEIGERTIREMWKWTWRCRGCGRYFENDVGPECPVCGSPVRKTRKRN